MARRRHIVAWHGSGNRGGMESIDYGKKRGGMLDQGYLDVNDIPPLLQTHQ